jgi:cytochrome P450
MSKMAQADSRTGDPEIIELLALMTSSDRLHRYAEIREASPVVRCRYVDGSPMWLVTRHAEARVALADTRLASDSSRHGSINTAAANAVPEDVGRYFTGNMLDRDPPEHTRLRRLVARAFTARRVESLGPQVQEAADALLDAAAGSGTVDLVSEFADMLPIQVICQLFGVPRDEWQRWASTSKRLTEMGPAAAQAAGDLVALAREVIELKRSTPQGDLITDLVRLGDEDGDRLSDDELVTTVITLLGTGHESTVQLLSNSLAALVLNPEMAELLRRDPARVPAAVEEFLRYFTPFELSGLRFATEPVELGGVTIPAGDAVQILLAAGDRDPRAFERADELDISRQDAGGHLAFGHGIHYCIGAALARTQGAVAVRTVLRRFPALVLACPTEQLVWRHTFVSGPVRLPVHLPPAA